VKTPDRCKSCGNHHSGLFCPDVKSIKYYSNGNIEQIEYYPTTDKVIEFQLKDRVNAELKRIAVEQQNAAQKGSLLSDAAPR
jgi:hypothetical protein